MTAATPTQPTASRGQERARAAASCCVALALAGCGTSHPRPLAARLARRSPDVPVLPRLLGRPELPRAPAGRRRRPARATSPRSATASTTATACRARASSAAAAASCRCRSPPSIYALHSNAALGAAAQHPRPRRPRDRLRRRPLDRDLHRQGRHRRLLRHLRARARRHEPAAPAERPRLVLRRPARPRLLPRPVRARVRRRRLRRDGRASRATPASSAVAEEVVHPLGSRAPKPLAARELPRRCRA